MKEYKGMIILESLEDKDFLSKLDVISIKATDEPEPNDRWHIYTVKVSQEEILELEKIIKQGWYAHFWNGKEVIAVFRNKTFSFVHNNKSTWKPAVNYGLSLGISREQLDFPID